MREFYETKKMYREYTQYRRPLSYDEWHVLPEGHKAAVLFVQFLTRSVWPGTRPKVTMETNLRLSRPSTSTS